MKQSRIPRPFAPHLSWDLFIAQQQQEDPRDFIKCLRMPIEAFEHLHSLLEVKLQKNQIHGRFAGWADQFQTPVVPHHLIPWGQFHP